MKNKVIGVTKPIYELVKVLEGLEDKIEFTVFYSFAEILESHHFCPAWSYDEIYYEIQYDNEDVLQVIDFGVRGHREEGDVLTVDEVIKLTKLLQTARL